MSELFPLLFDISLEASFIGLFIWIILKTPLSKYFSANTLLILWSLVLLRFLIPWNFEINSQSVNETLSIENQNRTQRIFQIFQHFEVPEFEDIFAGTFKPTAKEEQMVVARKLNISSFLSGFWLLGFAGIGLIFFVQCSVFGYWSRKSCSAKKSEIHRLLQKIKSDLGIKRDIQLLVSERIGSAAIIGILNPTVILSPKLIESCSQQQLRTILTHELTHFKEGHLLINQIGLLVCAIHWFNPFSWFFYRELRHAIELACDNAAISSKVTESPESYAHHLVDLVQLAPIRPPLSLGFLGLFNNLKSKFIQTRIVMIKNHSQYKLPISLVLSIGLLGICLGSTNIKTSQLAPNGTVEKQPAQFETISTESQQLIEIGTSTTPFSELNLDIDVFAKSPDFSANAKVFVKEELLGHFEANQAEKALPLMLTSPFASEAQMQFLIGNIHLQANRQEEAKKAYVNSFNSVPSSKPLKNLILIYMSTGEHAEASPLLEKYIALANNSKDVSPDAQIFLMAGVAAMQTERWNDSEKHFLEAIKINPEELNAQLNLFQVYMMTEQYAKSESVLQTLISQTEDSEKLNDYYKYYANVALGLEDYNLAITMLEKRIQLSPDDEQAKEMLIRLKNGDNNKEQLKLDIDKSTLKNPIDTYEIGDVDSPPRPIKQVPPVYPQALKKKKINGKVILSFIVDQKGAVGGIAVEGTTNSLLNAPAIEALEKWTFKPGELDGKAVKVRVKAPMIFKVN